jgi:2-keto-3-deoxy-L-rhamnonate aldolase RhmA
MRRSKTVAKLRESKFVRCTALGHVIPAYFQMASANGYDCIWFDLEHRAMDDREVQLMLAYAHLADIDVMVRTPTLEKQKLYRDLEDGASGIMVPHCNTKARAEFVRDAIKFPPLGDRGLDGAGFDSNFLYSDISTYQADANAETFLVCQIETLEALDNAADIASVEGVDMLFIGPGDLGMRLKHDPRGRTLDDAMDIVSAACEKHGKHWAITSGTMEEITERRRRGAKMIPWGGDFGFLKAGLEARGRELEEMGD